MAYLKEYFNKLCGICIVLLMILPSLFVKVRGVGVEWQRFSIAVLETSDASVSPHSPVWPSLVSLMPETNAWLAESYPSRKKHTSSSAISVSHSPCLSVAGISSYSIWQ